MDERTLLKEIEPVAADLLNRHLGVAKEWFPHEMVPYSRGKDFEPGKQWTQNDSDFGADEIEMSDAVRGSLFVNLLTEDNLPYYFRDINSLFGNDGVYGEWGRNWTAEEGRHSIVIRDYLTVTRAIDPIALERGRMQQVRGGEVPAPLDLYEALAYLSMQELATRIAHRNTGKMMHDEVGEAIMARVGNDENLHYLFYRDLTTAAIAVDPSNMIIGIERAVRTFAMPGTGIPDFERLSREIARVGIYDLLIHHDQILQPVVMRHWKLEQVTGLTDEAEKAREALFKRIERIGKVGAKMASDRVSATSASIRSTKPAMTGVSCWPSRARDAFSASSAFSTSAAIAASSAVRPASSSTSSGISSTPRRLSRPSAVAGAAPPSTSSLASRR